MSARARRSALLAAHRRSGGGGRGPACATSPYKRAGNAGDVASALARSQPRARRSGAQPGFPGAGRDGRSAPGGLRSGRVARALDAAGRGHDPRSCVGARRPGSRQQAGGRAGGSASSSSRATSATAPCCGSTRSPPSERLAGYDVDADVGLHGRADGRRDAGARRHGGSVVALDARTGAVRWRHPLPSGRVGGPAARGGLVAVPVDSQYVILLDGATGARAGAGAVDGGGGDVRARAARRDVLRLARRVPAVAVDGARLARRRRATCRRGCRRSCARSTGTTSTGPSRRSTRRIDRNHILWRVDGRRRARPLPRRPVGRPRLPVLLRVRRRLGRAALGVQPPGGRGGVDGHRQRDPVRQRDGDIGAARRAHGRALLPGAAARRGGARRDVRRGGIFAARVAGGRSAAPRLDVVATLVAIIADPDQAVPRPEAVRDRGARAAARAARRRASCSRSWAGKGCRRSPSQKAGEALAARRDTQSADMLAARCACTPTTPRGARRRRSSSWPRRSAALGPGGRVGVAGAGRAPAAPGDAAAGGGADRARAGRHGRRGARPGAARLPDHVPRRSRVRRGSDGADRRLPRRC